jgi:hypothetical protein
VSKVEEPRLGRTLGETIEYLESSLSDIVKLFSKLNKINKTWEGIDRSFEMVIYRARSKLPEIQVDIEDVYFKLKQEVK